MPPPLWTFMSQCHYCKYNFGEKEIKGHGWWHYCAVFPRAVPLEIWTNYVDHTKPYPGDSGVCFEPRFPSDREAQRIAFHFREDEKDKDWDKAAFKAATDAAVKAEEQSEQAKIERYKLQREFPPHPALQHNPVLLARYQNMAGFWSTRNPRHAIFHEVGHEELVDSLHRIDASAPWGRALLNVYDEEKAQEVHDEAWVNSSLNDKGNGISIRFAKLILKEVGRHAFQSNAEFVAEVFVALVAGGRSYSPELISLYKNLAGPDTIIELNSEVMAEHLEEIDERHESVSNL